MMDQKRIMQRYLRRYLVGTTERKRVNSELDDVVPRLPRTHQEAAQRLTDWKVVKSRKYQKSVVFRWEGTHPALVMFSMAFSAALRGRGYPFLVHQAQGTADLVGCPSPAHECGCALDLVHAVRMWDLTRLEWSVVGAIGKEIARKRNFPAVWGGDSEEFDPSHWEVAHWEGLVAARAELEAMGVELPAEDVARFALLESQLDLDQDRRTFS